jgi:hypothetical protein
MREQLELAAAGDERVRFLEPVPRERVGAAIEAHDVVVVPSLWECWPNVVREAFLHNRPVLATPTGGLVELVEPGVSGWLAGGTSARALRRELDTLAERPEHARELIAAGGPRRAFDRVADPERTRRESAALLAEPRPSPPPAARRPAGGVSVVVPYFRLDAHVEETLDSIAAQTVPVLEVVVVNDGSLREADGIVDRLAAERGLRLVTRPNAGLAAARNLGVAVARGDFVLPLDADNVLEPDFVERCLHALARDERLAYATSWTRWIDEHGVPLGDGLGHQPLGNWTSLVERNNWAGDGTALIRRAVFDAGLAYDVELTSYEDWFLYRQMHHAGLLGDVIPRRLLRYRVRAASMVRTVGLPHEARIYDEMTARLAEWRMTWTA